MQLVKSGEVDLVLSSPPPSEESSIEFTELFQYNVVLMTPPGHPLLETHPIQLEDAARWPLILAPESQTRQRVEQALKNKSVAYDIVLEMDNTELIKRYVETGMGVAIGPDFTLHPEDHDKLGVVRLDHLFPNSAIGICSLKGKFQGRAVRNFMDTLVDDLKGYHAELEDWESSRDVSA